jgi:hypothetical protein
MKWLNQLCFHLPGQFDADNMVIFRFQRSDAVTNWLESYTWRRDHGRSRTQGLQESKILNRLSLETACFKYLLPTKFMINMM